MMNIVYNGNIQVLIDATAKANEILQSEKFYTLISQRKSFYFSDATGQQVADSMQRCSMTLEVITYKKLLTRALGYEDPYHPQFIHVNVAGKKLDRSFGSIVGTLIHEAVHAADSNDEVLDYEHDGNAYAGNEDTAPYVVDNIATEMVDNPGAEIDVNNLTASNYKPDDEMEKGLA